MTKQFIAVVIFLAVTFHWELWGQGFVDRSDEEED